jgi:hypothetical protein
MANNPLFSDQQADRVENLVRVVLSVIPDGAPISETAASLISVLVSVVAQGAASGSDHDNAIECLHGLLDMASIEVRRKTFEETSDPEEP